MIATSAIGSVGDFESLLEKATQDLVTALAVGTPMAGKGFEEAVLKAMNRHAEGTVFEGRIARTQDNSFPDIVANEHFGVEVKYTSKSNLAVSGNSIFEQTRIGTIQEIYLIIANAAEPPRVVWRKYQDALENIVVTHSPRYAINAEAKATVFEKMNIEYDEFRQLDTEAKMQKVKRLYDNSKLWWLSQESIPLYRFFSGLSAEEKRQFTARLMVVCPEIFGSSPKKFENAAMFALSLGIINPSFRDTFTAGGKKEINGKLYPHIYYEAVQLEATLRGLCDSLDGEVLQQFWDCDIPDDSQHRWKMWLDLVDSQQPDYKISDILKETI